MQKQFLTHIRLDLPLELFIPPSHHSPTGLLTQQEYPIEWIYIHFRGTKSLTPYLDLIMLIIINGRKRAKTLIGSNPHKIGAPINKSQFKNALQTSIDFQIAFLEYFEEIPFHYPSNKLWNFLKNTEFILSHIFTSQPIPQTDVFCIDGTKTPKPHFGLSKNIKSFILNFTLLNKTN